MDRTFGALVESLWLGGRFRYSELKKADCVRGGGAVRLWELNRLSPATIDGPRVSEKRRKLIWDASAVHDVRSIARVAPAALAASFMSALLICSIGNATW